MEEKKAEEKQEKNEIKVEHTRKNWYDKYYKILLFIPVLILILSLIYLFIFYQTHNDILLRDISLSGGTSITLLDVQNPDMLENILKEEISDVSFRKLSDIKTGEHTALVLESSLTPEELKPKVEKALGTNLTEENSSIEFSGPTLSRNFFKQLLIALASAFLLMSFVVFCLFGKNIKNKLILGLLTFITIILLLKYHFILAAPLIILIFISYLFLSLPSIAVIFAAFSDIVIPLALVNFLGIKLSAAGIAAFLMLVGYSVDTDILLTTKAIKNREGTHNQRIFQAFKTGTFMTSTALFAVLPAFFLITGLPDSFRQIFLILAIGLFADLINTWFTNAGIIKWYCVKKGIN